MSPAALAVAGAALLAVVPGKAAAQAYVRPLSEEDVRRTIPVLRVVAAAAEEARREQAKVAGASGQAQGSSLAARGGQADPVRAFREAGGDRLVPPGFRIDEACSRSLTTHWSRPAVVATAGFANDAAARQVAGCGPGGKADQALNEKSDQAARRARAHLEKQGFQAQGPRLAGKRFAAGVLTVNCLRESPGEGCAGLPSGPCVTFTDEEALRSFSRAVETQQAGDLAREARVARAAEAAGFSPQDLDDLRAALLIAAEDARNPERVDALAAIPGELGAMAALRRKNLAVYRKAEGELGPLLEGLSKGPP